MKKTKPHSSKGDGVLFMVPKLVLSDFVWEVRIAGGKHLTPFMHPLLIALLRGITYEHGKKKS